MPSGSTCSNGSAGYLPGSARPWCCVTTRSSTTPRSRVHSAVRPAQCAATSPARSPRCASVAATNFERSAMNNTEQDLRDALALLEQRAPGVEAVSIATGARAGRDSRRWVLPLAAALAVCLVAVAVVVFTRHHSNARTSAITPPSPQGPSTCVETAPHRPGADTTLIPGKPVALTICQYLGRARVRRSRRWRPQCDRGSTRRPADPADVERVPPALPGGPARTGYLRTGFSLRHRPAHRRECAAAMPPQREQQHRPGS